MRSWEARIRSRSSTAGPSHTRYSSSIYSGLEDSWRPGGAFNWAGDVENCRGPSLPRGRCLKCSLKLLHGLPCTGLLDCRPSPGANGLPLCSENQLHDKQCSSASSSWSCLRRSPVRSSCAYSAASRCSSCRLKHATQSASYSTYSRQYRAVAPISFPAFQSEDFAHRLSAPTAGFSAGLTIHFGLRCFGTVPTCLLVMRSFFGWIVRVLSGWPRRRPGRHWRAAPHGNTSGCSPSAECQLIDSFHRAASLEPCTSGRSGE